MILRFGETAARLQHGAEIVVRLRVIGIDPEGFAHFSDRFVPHSAKRQRVAEVVMR